VAPPFLAGTPATALVALLAALLGCWALVLVDVLPHAAADGAALAAIHGAMLGTAVAWARPAHRRARWAPLVAGALLVVPATLGPLHPAGLIGYAAIPAWLLLLGARRLVPALAPPVPWATVAAGALFGALLGGHLLVGAALTFGYGVRLGPAAELAGWWAYDLGANVPSAELFFRGALFDRLHRRWALAPAAAVATAACLVRYLADPLLPRSPEMLVGAAFYLTVLGAGCAWLLARTGSLLPGLAAATVFFAGYRLLAPPAG
jgi:hypothetical protein